MYFLYDVVYFYTTSCIFIRRRVFLYDVVYFLYDVVYFLYDVVYFLYDVVYFLYDVVYFLYDVVYFLYDVVYFLYDVVYFFIRRRVLLYVVMYCYMSSCIFIRRTV